MNSLSVPRWTQHIIRDLVSSHYAELSLVIENAGTPFSGHSSTRTIRARLRDLARKGLYNCYLRWDYARHTDSDSPFTPQDITGLVAGIPILRVSPLCTKFSDRFSEADLQHVRSSDLDVLLRFGFRILRGDILHAARYGVWSYHHGDNREYRGGPALFWEMYERNPVSGSVLQILNESLDGGQVIYRSFGHTEFDSLYANRKPIYWKSAEFMIRRLRDLHCHGWDYIKALAESEPPESYKKRIYRTPTNWQMARFLTQRVARGLGNRSRRLLFHERDHNWFIAYRRTERPGEAWRFLWPPKGHFYADPFLFRTAGKTYLFFEDYLHAVNKGIISMVELYPNGEHSAVLPVLETDSHLSYPFVFEHEGEVYLLPETVQARRVELYRAAPFPLGWTFDRVLIDDVACVDPTPFFHENRWWLFANIAADGASTWDELHLFFSNELFGTWHAHPKNPIVSDVRSARPAGRLFYRNHQLLRPSQDCSHCYGYSVILNRVDVLNEREYAEVPIEAIGPGWLPRNLGTHSLTMTDEFEARDGKTPFWKLRSFRSATAPSTCAIEP